jgi:bifunctional DNA-binding transcriptional regulator/antitoxin component of YhaV-PrlF toxin-antitoxin module
MTAMSSSSVMKVSSNGQVSIPAHARARWQHPERMLVVDMGDRIVMRPLPEDPIGALTGKYRRRGPTTADARRHARREEAAAERRKRV